MAHALFESEDRQAAQTVECDSAGKGGPLFCEDIFVQPVECRDPAHHEHLLGAWLCVERCRQRAREINLGDDAGRWGRPEQTRSRCKHDRDRLKQRPILVQERHDRWSRRDHQIDTVLGDVPFAQVIAKSRVVPVVAETCEVDIFAVVVDLIGECDVESGAKRVVEGWRIAPDDVEGEHLLGRLPGCGLAVGAGVRAGAGQ